MQNHLKYIVVAVIFVIAASLAIFNFKHDVSEVSAEHVASIKGAYVDCINLGEEFAIGACLEDLTEKAYAGNGVEEVVAELSTLSYDEKMRWCHETMHYLGWQVYTGVEDLPQALLQASGLCDNGMYHGVMEQYLRREGLSGNIEDLVRTACRDSLANYPNFSDGIESLCYHGLGHGLMFITNADLGASLNYCDVLDGNQAGSCYGGAYMEYSTSKAVGPLHGNRKVDLEDFSYCEDLKEAQKPSCYHRQGINNHMATENGNVHDAMELCMRIENIEYRQDCFVGAGSNTASPDHSHHDSGIMCQDAMSVSGEAYKGCIAGAMGFVMQIEHGDIAGGIEFCEATDESQQYYCYQQVGKQLRVWMAHEIPIEEKCAPLQENEQAFVACVEGIEED